MALIDQAIELLKLTHDGGSLSPTHLSLLQSACNGILTEEGEVAFEELYRRVKSGTYELSWMCGVQHLTQDHQGYVYWRGRHVEHYSYTDFEQKREAAERLAQRCLSLEAKGFPVNARTAICSIMEEAPADTPWLEALTCFYAFFHKDDAVRVVFFKQDESLQAIALEKQGGVIVGEVFEGGYEAYHGTVAHGYQSAGCGLSYPQIVSLLEQSGLTPDEIHAAIH